MKIAKHIDWELNKTVVFFSLETKSAQLVARLIGADDANASVMALKHIADNISALSESSLYIDDTPGIDPAEMLTKLRRLKERTGDISLIVIDYFQLLTISVAKNRKQEQFIWIKAIKEMAQELSAPVVLTYRLSPDLSEMKERREIIASNRPDELGAVGKAADIVMVLEHEHVYEYNERLEPFNITIVKNPSGFLGSIKVL